MDYKMTFLSAGASGSKRRGKREGEIMNISKIIIGALAFSQLSMGLALADAPSIAAIVKPSEGYVWRLDTKNKLQLPRNYRADDTNRMSGSAQPSILELSSLVQELSAKGIKPKQIILVDLRQESHGFLNGQAVSWYGDNNWANVGKADVVIRKDETDRLTKTLDQETSYYKLDKKKKPHFKGKEKVQVALTEQQAATLFGMGYARFASTDHIWPDPEEVDAFLQWQKDLPEDAWLHFHCQAGKGRTTSYMIMRDIWLNGQKDSLESICARQQALGGVDVLHMTHKEAWRQTIDDNKVYRLKQFYTYVKGLQQGTISGTWTEYIRQNP